MCEPDDGIPFISLSWAGMAGVVSGMNRAGISVTVNGAPTSLPRETATPVAIVARHILQQAHNHAEPSTSFAAQKCSSQLSGSSAAAPMVDSSS